MKKLILILSVFTLIFTMGFGVHALTAQAEDQADDIQHYEGKVFTKKKQAIKALKETSAQMAEIVASETLDIAKMEQIHQTSYTTEDAIAFLDKKGKYDLSDLAEKLEEVHLASEDHKAEELRRDFIAYQAELVEYFESK